MRDLPAPDDGDPDPDIVLAMIAEVLEVGVSMTDAQKAAIERRVKQKYGDRRIRVKKKLQFTVQDDLRARVFADGQTDMTTREIASRNGISTRTVYYWMKKGNPLR